MFPKLILKDKTEMSGISFGYEKSAAGEVVFSTGMVGYPESLTDPSYKGQILVLTYPLIGNYGVPSSRYFESKKLQISGLIVSTYNDTPSHPQSVRTLSSWLREEKVPALEIKDTRQLALKIRTHGAILGKIVFKEDLPFYDPNKDNLVHEVSTKKVTVEGKGKIVVLIDCGTKENIRRSLLARGLRVVTVPWDYNIFSLNAKPRAVVVSNGPGDPKKAEQTIATVKKLLERRIPTLGICLGNQILTLAAGGDTKKMKFGHRSQNQPCIQVGTKRAFLTTQNHGFVVSRVPPGFSPWFINANDGTNEGIIHKKFPFMSVQFHPEATPGPVEAEWVFDFFLKKI